MTTATTTTRRSDRLSKVIASCRSWLRKLAADRLLTFRFDVDPAPASRPKVGRFGVYYGKNYERFRREAQPIANSAGMREPVASGPLIALVESVVARPKTGTSRYPRGDSDNYVKGPFDVMTKSGRFWRDDGQIVGCVSFKRYAQPGEEPAVYVEWFELDDEATA